MEKLRVLGEFFFSQIQGKPIYDHQGRQVGKVAGPGHLLGR